MGKAARHKERRRSEAAVAEAKRAKRQHILRWSAFIIIFTLCATIIFPALYDKYGNNFLEKRPFSGKETTMNNDHPVMQIVTPKGTITVELNRQKAPQTVDHITALVNKGFYNGLTFHRVEPGFVVQGGDPKGDGSGGSGQTISFEANDLKHEKGVIAMARSQDKNSADSQFYITLAPQPSLDGEYVVFGKVTSGLEVVEQIAKGDKMTNVVIKSGTNGKTP